MAESIKAKEVTIKEISFIVKDLNIFKESTNQKLIVNNINTQQQNLGITIKNFYVKLDLNEFLYHYSTKSFSICNK